MSEKKDFYTVAAESFDLVLASVVDAPGPQVFRAKVERIYSSGKGITPDLLGAEITFTGGPPTWGNVALQVGERALMFVRVQASGLNEYPWCGHMVLEDMDGELGARLHVSELWLRDDFPEAVKAAASQHPTWRNASIVKFSVLESYLKGLIARSAR
ncbi:hypothetical protein P350_06065 [Burkholderia cepacia JBK9]|uniref:Uncharacterized protein n=1 Tax=Burkholderia arboris TaxID=488730 RepID=A0A9Q9SIV0_9BURK|nr:hypothetical protein [Burkholderia arboris]ALX11142.1 hypothetical protein P350_06065 [Burkholderia cepacia JBK9]MCA8492895.1 hypothetical protein [Burkholderia arboris]UTV54003.1 hypothetical protein NLX30_14125 [Burkholderia arboris]VWB69633.1 hypothetical protein BAR24066_03256 [Burkholderia arboris]